MLEYNGLDETSPQTEPLLRGLQGNILKSHGREYAAHLLLRFPRKQRSIAAVKEWIRSLPVTSALEQSRAAARFRATRKADAFFVGFYLSASGYKALGFKPSDLPRDSAFREGMKLSSRLRLCDPDSFYWEPQYQHNVDALLLIAHDNPQTLQAECSRLTKEAETIIGERIVQGLEWGTTLRNEKGEPVEHFGYADGISQPLFMKRDIDRFLEKHGPHAWDPTANPFHLVLVPEPFVDGAYGSYMVLRKLEQNVQAFFLRRRELERRLMLDPDAVGRGGALVMGRFPDGTPLAISPHSSNQSPNDFTFKDDPAGNRCPFQSHLRKMNPRNQSPSERAHRIARRGIPYGERSDNMFDNNPETKPVAGCGLLFMCFQRDVSRQFEFLQRVWANGLNHPADVGYVGLDPITGQTSAYTAQPAPQLWPPRWGDPTMKRIGFDFTRMVKMVGGEYFFAPGVQFLRTL